MTQDPANVQKPNTVYSVRLASLCYNYNGAQASVSMTTKLFGNANSSHVHQELEASLRRAPRGRNINLVILYQP